MKEIEKEVCRAKFYNYPPYQIAEITNIPLAEVLRIIRENKEYMEELEARIDD